MLSLRDLKIGKTYRLVSSYRTLINCSIDESDAKKLDKKGSKLLEQRNENKDYLFFEGLSTGWFFPDCARFEELKVNKQLELF